MILPKPQRKQKIIEFSHAEAKQPVSPNSNKSRRNVVLTRHLTNCSASLIIFLSHLLSVNHALDTPAMRIQRMELATRPVLPSQPAEQGRAELRVRPSPCISLSLRLPSFWGRYYCCIHYS